MPSTCLTMSYPQTIGSADSNTAIMSNLYNDVYMFNYELPPINPRFTNDVCFPTLTKSYTVCG